MAENGQEKVLGTSSKSPDACEQIPFHCSKLLKQTEEASGSKSGKYDKGLSVLEQYGLNSETTYRGRGVLICRTEAGLKMIKPYSGSEKRLQKMNQVLEHLQKNGHEGLDLILKNKDGNLISEDKEGYAYLVKNWQNAKECDVRSESDVVRCMEKMALLHKDLSGIFPEKETESENLQKEYEKHNRQMKKIREYIRRRKQKNAFEYQYLKTVERYLYYGEAAISALEQIGYKDMRRYDLEKGSICHGMCNQHNFLISDSEVFLMNFDCFFMGNHMADVTQFLRKIMEKQNWDPHLAEKMLRAYDNILHISDENWRQLRVRMMYPEKYWKIANFYYNNNKAFFPENHLKKLNGIIRQEKSRTAFLEEVLQGECIGI